MDQSKSIELQKKRLESAEERARLGLQVHVHNPLIIVYDKGGTVEVYGEYFKLICLFCLLLLHVSETSNLLMYIQKYKEWARSPCNGNHFSSMFLGFSGSKFSRKKKSVDEVKMWCKVSSAEPA